MDTGIWCYTCLLDLICQEPATADSFTLVVRHNMSAIIHGWYRFTDILWAWYTNSRTSELFFIHPHRQEVLDNDDEVKALKSFIHAESLTSPQHPFYDPKAEGVKMYMGKYHKLDEAKPLSNLGHRNLARRGITSLVLFKTSGIHTILDQSYGTGRSAHPAA